MSLGRCIYREESTDAHLEIWEQDDCRSLWFDDVILQTEIYIQDPAVLPNPLNRAMLAHLMLGLPLTRVMLAGCGGGAIARWLHARAPEVTGEAVELSPTVARLAREYFDFPPVQSNWQLLVEDVREHLPHNNARYDFILVDLEEDQITPAWVTGPEFLKDCLKHLSDDGVLTINLILNGDQALSESLFRIRQVFGNEAFLVTEPDYDNLLVMAFRAAPVDIPANDVLEQRGRQWGIDFISTAARMTRLAAVTEPPAG